MLLTNVLYGFGFFSYAAWKLLESRCTAFAGARRWSGQGKDMMRQDSEVSLALLLVRRLPPYVATIWATGNLSGVDILVCNKWKLSNISLTHLLFINWGIKVSNLSVGNSWLRLPFTRQLISKNWNRLISAGSCREGNTEGQCFVPTPAKARTETSSCLVTEIRTRIIMPKV